MTLVYDSSQSAILSLGEKTGQLSGNFRYGMWSYQTGSCRQSDLYRLRHWSPGRARLSMTIVGTLSWRSLAASPMPACPPPTISTYGCSVTPRFRRSASRSSSQVVRSRFAPCSAPIGRRSSCPVSSYRVVSRVQHWPPRSRRWPCPRPAEVSKSIQASVMPSVSAGSSPSVTVQPVGCTRDSVASSMRVISARPSKVLKFQVKEMRSRQKQSSVNKAAALAGSFATRASLNPASQVVTAAAASVCWTVVVIGGLPSSYHRAPRRTEHLLASFAPRRYGRPALTPMNSVQPWYTAALTRQVAECEKEDDAGPRRCEEILIPRSRLCLYSTRPRPEHPG